MYFAVVKYVNPITGVAFIACGRDYYRMVWSALAFIRTIIIEDSARPCMFRVLHVGGKKYYFSHLLVTIILVFVTASWITIT